MHAWQKYKATHPVSTRAVWSAVLVFIFLLGKSIPLPYTDAKSLVLQNATLNFASLATGGNLSQLSLFSMGIAPWMSAMIIANLLTQSRSLGLDRMSANRLDYISKEITLILAVIQAFVVVANLQLTVRGIGPKLAVGLVLVAGALYCVWLSNMNGRFGLGGPTLLVLANILQSALGMAIDGIAKLAGSSTARLIWILVGLAIFLVLFAYLNVMMDRGEYRLPIIHLLIDSQYASRSYLPIKLTPAGGMPIMFAMALVTLPTYLCLFLLTFWPHNQLLAWGAANFTFTKFPGVVLYLILLGSLSMAFAYINVNAERQTKTLQQAGDYLLGVRPGVATRQRINQVVLICGMIGALYNMILAGGPMLLVVQHPSQMNIYMLPGYILMVVGFSMGMIDQINTLEIRRKYRPLFE